MPRVEASVHWVSGGEGVALGDDEVVAEIELDPGAWPVWCEMQRVPEKTRKRHWVTEMTGVPPAPTTGI